MKKIFQILGIIFIIGGFVFLYVYSTVVAGSPNEDFARDLFGFPIPHPPVWTSYIPILGSISGFVFEFFSLHGLIGIVIAGLLLCIGGLLTTFGEWEKRKRVND